MAEQRGDAFEAGAVADARGHGDHRRAGEAADDAGQRPLHAGDDDHGVGVGELGGVSEQAVDAGHAHVGEPLGPEPVGGQDGGALVGHRAGRPCRR